MACEYETRSIDSNAEPGSTLVISTEINLVTRLARDHQDRTVVPLAAPIIFIGTQPDRPWCPAWGFWRNEGDANPNSEEPPADHWVREIWRIWDEEIAIEPDEEKQHAAFRKILEIWKDGDPDLIALIEARARLEAVAPAG